MKTLEEMAEEYADLCVSDAYYAPLKAGFLAGYKAAKELYAAKLKEANDTVAGMADECEGLKSIIYDHDETNLPTSAQWISVKEQMPEEGEDVLVFDEGVFSVNGLSSYTHKWHPYENGFDCEPSYWMPLPEAPKEER